MVNRWSFFDQILRQFPQACLLCDIPGRGQPLCQGCRQDLPWNTSACELCALPVPTGQTCCAACLQKPPLQTRTLAPLRYEFPADHLVAGLKYHGRLAHAPLLGKLLGELLYQRIADKRMQAPDLLLPVPLHRTRLGERGYNQAMEIARPLARQLRLPLEIRLLTRHRATAAQMQLDAAQRARNPRGAFRIEKERLAALKPPQHVAVIDDVMTTGTTLAEITRLLRDAGIPEISLLVVARTP